MKCATDLCVGPIFDLTYKFDIYVFYGVSIKDVHFALIFRCYWENFRTN